jgi:hypothetical protein
MADSDNDGFEPPEDCDDTNADVNPDAEEACGNLVDDDCDGATDDGCEATAGTADPGGMSWICGSAPGGTWAGAWPLLVLPLLRRRR